MAEYLQIEPNDEKPFCFVSYKSDNKKQLYTIVKGFQFNAWYDFGIHYDDPWRAEIARHIRESDAVILFLSREVLVRDSFVIKEFRLAKKLKKRMLIVYLEPINTKELPDYIDDDVVFDLVEMEDKQCLVFREDRTTDELISVINEGVSRFFDLNSGEKKKQEKRLMSAQPYSAFKNGSIKYAGYLFSHLSKDTGKICLYNKKSRAFEIRLTDDPDKCLGSFRYDPDKLKTLNTFFSTNNRFLYFLWDGTLYVYDLVNDAWLDKNGKKPKLRFSRNECLNFVVPSVSSDTLYFLAKTPDFISRILPYRFSQNAFPGDIDITDWQLHSLISAIKTKDGQHLIAVDLNDQLRDVRLDGDADGNITAQRLTYEGLSDLLIQNISQEFSSALNGKQISADGLIYSVETGGNVRVFDTIDARLLDDFFDKSYALLCNRTILKYDRKGVLTRVCQGRSETVIPTSFFMDSAAFSGAVPHTFAFDEENSCYIFVSSVAKNREKAVVLDDSLNVIKESENLEVRNDRFLCDCMLAGNRLWLSFSCFPDTGNVPGDAFLFRLDYME